MRGPGAGCRLVAAGILSLLALAALGIAFAWQQIFDALLAAQLELRPGSRAFQEWVTPSVPIYFDVYMFNWTNADRFPDETPHVEEIGPYRFREERRHVNVTWHPHNCSVGYRTFRSWQFEADTSGGTLDDNINMPNVVAASAVYRSRLWGFMRQTTVSMGLNLYKQKIHVTKTARELLFEGYPDEMLDMARTLPTSMTGGAPPVDRFGWFYGRNNSIETEGYMEVSTGAESGSLPGQLLKWNYEDRLSYYEGHCAKLEGSAGEFMPRNMTVQSELTMFVADLCRPLRLQYTGGGDTRGLHYHTYSVTERSFDNSSEYEGNSCFCNGECSWGGLMNVSACRYGAPAFVSLPHFLHGASHLQQQVTGLRPDPDKHSFYFSVEPRNGSMTYDGVFVMNTGSEEFSQLGNLEMWQNSNRTPYEGECGRVRGSTGELWAPELGQPEVYIFAPDICTYMILPKNSSHRVGDIDGVMYAANNSVFDNGHQYPHMSCYCSEEHPLDCMPSGALNVSTCRYGAPAFVSLPHFYNADPVYGRAVDGLAPTSEHNFRLTLEMFTGIPLEVAAQLQVNLLVRRVPGFTILDSFENDTMVPMFWFRQELQITPEFADMAKFALNLRYGMMYGLYALTGIGVVLLMAGIIVLIRKLMVSPETTPILQDTADSPVEDADRQ